MTSWWKIPNSLFLILVTITVLGCLQSCKASTKCYLCHDNFEKDGRIVYNYDNCGFGVPRSYSRQVISKCHGGCYKLVTGVSPRDNMFHTIKACSSWFTECLKVSRNSTGGYYFGTAGQMKKCIELGNGPGTIISDASTYKRSKTGEVFIEQFVNGGQLYRHGASTEYRLFECSRDLCNGSTTTKSSNFFEWTIIMTTSILYLVWH